MPFPHQVPNALDPRHLSDGDRLLYAAHQGMVMTVIKGIRDGAPLNVTDENRCTPLHRTVMAYLPQDDATEIVRQLRNAGAREDLPDRFGATPLDLALRLGRSPALLKALMDPVDPDRMLLLLIDQWRTSARGYDQRCRQALRLGADPWAPHPDHRQPVLYSAVSMGCNGAIARFHQRGVALDRPLNEDGHTPLMVAAQEGQLLVTYALLRAGVDVHRTSTRGNTALHLGLYNPSIVAALLDAGASPERCNHDGVSVWERLAQHDLDAGSVSERDVLRQTRQVLTTRWMATERAALTATLNDVHRAAPNGEDALASPRPRL